MPNTGLKQATIAYFVSKPDGLPLDINGVLTSKSGNRQAVALLEGTTNPNPALYEVAFYFAENSQVSGNPTGAYDPISCPSGFIALSVNAIALKVATPSVSFALTSSDPWKVDDGGPDTNATLNQSNGSAGVFELMVTRTATEGQGTYYFRNLKTGETVALFVTNIENVVWVFASGTWNNNGYWLDAGIWPV